MATAKKSTTARKTARAATPSKTARKTAGTATARKTTRASAAPSAAGSAAASLAGIGKLLERIKIPGIDLAAIVESQRKDLEALAEANRQAYEGIKALAKRRNEILKDVLAEWQGAMKDAGGGDAITQRVERAKKGIKQAVASFRELADMEAKSRHKAWKVLQDRLHENLASVQKMIRPK